MFLNFFEILIILAQVNKSFNTINKACGCFVIKPEWQLWRLISIVTPYLKKQKLRDGESAIVYQNLHLKIIAKQYFKRFEIRVERVQSRMYS